MSAKSTPKMPSAFIQTALRRALFKAVSVFALPLLCPTGFAAEFQHIELSQGEIEAKGQTSVFMSSEGVDNANTSLLSALDLGYKNGLVLQDALRLPRDKGTKLTYTQTYNDVPVWNSQVVVDKKGDGFGVSAAANVAYGMEEVDLFDASALSSPEQVIQYAKDHYFRIKGLTEVEEVQDITVEFEQGRYQADLTYFIRADGVPRLSYFVVFFAHVADSDGVDRPVRPAFVIDAKSQEILQSFEYLSNSSIGKGPGGNSKTGGYAYGTDAVEGLIVTQQGTLCIFETQKQITVNLNHGVVNTPAALKPWTFPCATNGTKEINGALSPLNDAHAFTSMVLDMFGRWFNRPSFSSNKVYVRTHYSTGYDSANYDGSGINLGDGSDINHPWVSLDVIAHEAAHAYLAHFASLKPIGHGAAISESFADMTGEVAEFYATTELGWSSGRAIPDFLFAADVRKAERESERNLCDPTADGSSIDHRSQWSAQLDPHFAAGIFNKVFCTLTKKRGWDPRKAYEVFYVASSSWRTVETFENAASLVRSAAGRLGYQEQDVTDSFSVVGL